MFNTIKNAASTHKTAVTATLSVVAALAVGAVVFALDNAETTEAPVAQD